jgi:hypothetical protein
MWQLGFTWATKIRNIGLVGADGVSQELNDGRWNGVTLNELFEILIILTDI